MIDVLLWTYSNLVSPFVLSLIITFEIIILSSPDMCNDDETAATLTFIDDFTRSYCTIKRMIM